MVGLNVLQGGVCITVGIALVGGARRLAAVPRYWQAYCERHPLSTRLGLRYRFGVSHVGFRRLVAFWRVCGVLGIVGGASLILDPSRTIRLP